MADNNEQAQQRQEALRTDPEFLGRAAAYAAESSAVWEIGASNPALAALVGITRVVEQEGVAQAGTPEELEHIMQALPVAYKILSQDTARIQAEATPPSDEGGIV